MSDTAASFDDLILFGGREFAFGGIRGLLGRVLGSAAMGLAAVAAVGASAAAVAVTGLWLVGLTLPAGSAFAAAANCRARQIGAGRFRSLPENEFRGKVGNLDSRFPGFGEACGVSRRVGDRENGDGQSGIGNSPGWRS